MRDGGHEDCCAYLEEEKRKNAGEKIAIYFVSGNVDRVPNKDNVM